MKRIKVAVHGAYGKMGREVINTVCRESELELCGAVEKAVTTDRLSLPDGSASVPISSDIESIIKKCQPDVLVDFSTATAVMPAARTCAKQGVNLVIGTTGLTQDNINEINRLTITHQIGAVVAPNFTLGAVLMIHLARIAAKYFDDVEIIELHHQQKVDAPSGTAITTARAMAQARGKPFHTPEGQMKTSRGEQIEGISIHSVRLPGLMAHQEIIIGGPGQTLRIRHDSINRECYMPGVILAIKQVVKRKGLIYGLDTLLGL